MRFAFESGRSWGRRQLHNFVAYWKGLDMSAVFMKNGSECGEMPFPCPWSAHPFAAEISATSCLLTAAWISASKQKLCCQSKVETASKLLTQHFSSLYSPLEYFSLMCYHAGIQNVFQLEKQNLSLETAPSELWFWHESKEGRLIEEALYCVSSGHTDQSPHGKRK